ncbi:hypothetical protein ADEAN_000939300 [Angomonas deanei]|uniref:Uncharacterized protein n=1 Tax=Angomonas deanei TaxID=59799 RepID=A0A7G2CPV3_9TRYP|nr:hypothetical protein ADEAN_000939300 [Angomonas deanei]
MTSLPPEMNAQSVDQPHAPQLVPFLECVPRSWENAWWWGAFGGGHTYHAKALVSLMTTLFALGRDGPLRWSYPTLPRMMCVLASHPRSVYSTLEYLLYALSAFRHAAAQQFNSQALMQTVHDFFVDSDTVELSAREVAYYTRPIVHANEEEGLTLTESAQLVMQMESVESLNFTKLVSSHWGKQLIESYFA